MSDSENFNIAPKWCQSAFSFISMNVTKQLQFFVVDGNHIVAVASRRRSCQIRSFYDNDNFIAIVR